ncbi:biotin--[acetyl-CoA-carboxylase] ligase [Sedimentibacter sp.]|uniref:biotin--[acetyl-CoA-carboxylase] ligase n=1 Tax=Sedimentibacter sp. TaxID=1960295 RepID=UPI000EC2F85A|nr:biotin--[acetyl-CoA-carboxylase] ligase [Sedimentibacter sp.]HCX62787.1 biotin--[acetyl-CoA-carboxylase] ligase [Clostridiales bacterium]
MYDLNKINEYLNTDIIGRAIVQYDFLSSTAAKAKSIFNTCPGGLIVLSENQSKCIMRMGNEWRCFSDKNIYLSIILKPLVNNLLISKIDMISCAALHKTIFELYKIDCKIKWPNDILINGKKVSSIISNFTGKNSDGIIISFGINANMDNEDFDINEGIKNTSTSLKIESGTNIDRELFVGSLLNNLEVYYNYLIKNNIKEPIETCTNNSSIINNQIEVMKKGKKTKRKVLVKGIDEEGRLIVVNEKGNEETLNPGETILIYEA